MPRFAIRRAHRGQAGCGRMSAGERTQARSGICDRLSEAQNIRSNIDKRRRRMCPVCLANLAFITAGATSTSGLVVLAVKNFLFETQNETGGEENENRNSRSENECKRGKSFNGRVERRVADRAQESAHSREGIDSVARRSEPASTRTAMG